MKLWGTRVFQTVVGKTIAGVVVVTVGVGAAAAGGADVPLLRSTAADEADGAEDEELEDEELEDEELEDEELEDEELEDGSDDEGSDDGDEQAATASVDDDADGVDDPNHGEVVSTFTQETELTGCEKGQATAAVARGDVDPTADDLDDLLAPYLERCDRGDDEEAGEDDEASGGEAADWKSIRDDGRVARDDARQAFVDACGDDDEGDESDEGVEGDDLDGDDDEMSPECAELHAAAKQAQQDWKAEWHAARDAAKGPKGPDDGVDADDDEPEAASAPADEPGPPDHSKGNGKQQTDQSSSGGQGKGASKGNGKP